MSDDAAERLALADEFSGVVVGSGYGSMSIGIYAALEAADLILASDWLAEHDREVAAKALEDAAASYRGRAPEGGWNLSTAEPNEYQRETCEEWQVTATELDARAAAIREGRS